MIIENFSLHETIFHLVQFLVQFLIESLIWIIPLFLIIYF